MWDGGPNRGVTTASIIASMARASQHGQAVVAKQRGDAAGAIAGAATRLSAIYQVPFLSHSPMEPLNCTLHIRPDGAEIWVGTQVPVRAQQAVMAATGLPAEKVMVHNQLMGGAFGRRLEIDSIDRRRGIARQVDYPVKMVWTREEDMRHDYYRPYYYDRVAAGLMPRQARRPDAPRHRLVRSTRAGRPPRSKNGIDIDAVECAAETPYDIPAEHVDYVRHEPDGMNTSWWRGVGPTHNVFVVESFIDELAARGRAGPGRVPPGDAAQQPARARAC